MKRALFIVVASCILFCLFQQTAWASPEGMRSVTSVIPWVIMQVCKVVGALIFFGLLVFVILIKKRYLNITASTSYIMAGLLCISVAPYLFDAIDEQLVLSDAKRWELTSRVDTLCSLGQYEQALLIATRLIDRGGASTSKADAYVSRAECYVDLEQIDKALADTQTAVYEAKTDRERANAYCEQAEAHLAAGQKKKAETDIEMAEKFVPGSSGEFNEGRQYKRQQGERMKDQNRDWSIFNRR